MVPPSLALLKQVLDNLASPRQLDAHPWASSAMVMQECKRYPGLRTRSPGTRLAITVAGVFSSLLPPAPPRSGKRLDTRWGEFGLLAARYFAPFMYGLPYPASLQEAWYGIDDAILLFVSGAKGFDQDAAAQYRLAAQENGPAPVSTLSDWHRKGLLRLASAIDARQAAAGNRQALQAPAPQEAPVTEPAAPRWPRAGGGLLPWLVALGLALFLGLVLLLGGLKARQLYGLAAAVKQDAAQLRDVDGLDGLSQAGPGLAQLRVDLDALRAQAGPFLWMGPALGWFPGYGGDLRSAPLMLAMAGDLLTAAEKSYAAAGPLLQKAQAGSSLDLPGLSQQLLAASSSLSEAQDALERAQSARRGISVESLSPGTRLMLLEQVDPLISLLDDGLAAGLSLPRLLGATDEGPKTYLLLVQNEDELRPTGGFVSAIGTLVMAGGRIQSLSFEDSYAFDDWTKAYAPAPWQLQRYMDIPVLMLRDSSWFTDYRQAVQSAEQLYSLARGHSVDGVIAFDQHLLVLLLGAIGPVQVDGVPYPVAAQNAVSYMRAAKIAPPPEIRPEDWHRKAFINKLASGVLDRLLGGQGISWELLSNTAGQALDERHLLLQVDDARLTGLLERHGWDGAVRPGDGDFLMVVDANVGYTKSNALMQTVLAYDVDLTDPSAPQSMLAVLQRNNAPAGIPCAPLQDAGTDTEQDRVYALDRCYWDYMRVYKPASTQLLDATPHPIPAAAMLRGEDYPGQVDALQEDIPGVQAFGTLLLVPAGGSLDTTFRFRLPEGVIASGPAPGQFVYRLQVQKQPGSSAIPLALRVHLPAGAQLISAPQAAIVEGDYVRIQVDLRTDAAIELVFVPR